MFIQWVGCGFDVMNACSVFPKSYQWYYENSLLAMETCALNRPLQPREQWDGHLRHTWQWKQPGLLHPIGYQDALQPHWSQSLEQHENHLQHHWEQPPSHPMPGCPLPPIHCSSLEMPLHALMRSSPRIPRTNSSSCSRCLQTWSARSSLGHWRSPWSPCDRTIFTEMWIGELEKQYDALYDQTYWNATIKCIIYVNLSYSVHQYEYIIDT